MRSEHNVAGGRSENHVASSHSEYSPEEIAFLKELDSHLRTRPKRPMSNVELFRFIKSKDLIPAEEKLSFEVPIRRTDRREICIVNAEECDLD